MQSFPLFLSLEGRRALLVGGNDAAARKAELLLSAGARDAPESLSPLVMAALDTLLPWFAELRNQAQDGWTVAETTIGPRPRAMRKARGGERRTDA